MRVMGQNRGSASTIISELVDNFFNRHKGNANIVRLHLSPNHISIYDDGVEFDLMKASAATLGDGKGIIGIRKMLANPIRSISFSYEPALPQISRLHVNRFHFLPSGATSNPCVQSCSADFLLDRDEAQAFVRGLPPSIATCETFTMKFTQGNLDVNWSSSNELFAQLVRKLGAKEIIAVVDAHNTHLVEMIEDAAAAHLNVVVKRV